MKAEEFYRLNKYGKCIENEYFIAMQKPALFSMMEAYARMKQDKQTQPEMNFLKKKKGLSII